MIELALLLLGLGTSELIVTLRDAATGKPVDGAFVVAREFTTVGKLHGSKTYCVRADVARASGPSLAMRLPHAGTDTFSGARAIEAFAYQPGYCLARTADGRAASYGMYGPGFGAERPKPLDPAAETRLELRRAAQSAEDRLLYLNVVALALICGEPRWSDRGPDGIERLSGAMLAEAEGLARNRYEKSLVEKMRGVLVAARQMKPDKDGVPAAMAITAPRAIMLGGGFPRDFIVGEPELRVTWDASRNMAIAAMPGRIESAQVMAAPAGTRPGNAAVASSGGAMAHGNAAVARSGGAIAHGIVVQPKITISAGRPQPVIHCRHGAPSACDLNERDAQGATALHNYIGALKPAEVKVLLDAGADPSLGSKPSNVTPIETLVERLARTQPVTGTAKDAAEILEMLASHPRVTMARKLREDLAADPATWTSVQHSPGRQLLVDARQRLLAVPVRTDDAAGCAPLGYAGYEHSALPIRLRHP